MSEISLKSRTEWADGSAINSLREKEAWGFFTHLLIQNIYIKDTLLFPSYKKLWDLGEYTEKLLCLKGNNRIKSANSMSMPRQSLKSLVPVFVIHKQAFFQFVKIFSLSCKNKYKRWNKAWVVSLGISSITKM